MKQCDNETLKMKLREFLSHQGACSRRQAMQLIQSGHVHVNGRVVTEPSSLIDPQNDQIMLDGRTVEQRGYEYILLNKPGGYVTTVIDPHADRTVMDLLPKELQHIKPVGRLDKDTEGLLLLTNDGDTAYALTHPKFDVDKTYEVKIAGVLTGTQKKQLENGIILEGRKTAPAKVEHVKTTGKHTQFLMTIHEGRKRQIRQMVGSLDHHVVYLKRIIQGPLKLGLLGPGRWRKLDTAEIKSLKELKP